MAYFSRSGSHGFSRYRIKFQFSENRRLQYLQPVVNLLNPDPSSVMPAYLKAIDT